MRPSASGFVIDDESRARVGEDNIRIQPEPANFARFIGDFRNAALNAS